MGKFKETDAKTIRDVLTSYDQIKVPMYQRNYSWKSGDTEPVTILWNDLYDKFDIQRKFSRGLALQENETGEYLLGPMVIVQDNTPNPVQIVDGQQRLATLTMIFCIARDVILELNYEKIQANPEFWPAQLSELTDLIENSKTDTETDIPIFGNWRLELNEEDKKIYRLLVQEYVSRTIGTHKFLDDPSDKYYKISKKIAWAEDEIKGDSAELHTKSEILIMKAYIKLYDNVLDALIVNFENNLDTEEQKREINKKIAKTVEDNFKLTPQQFQFPVDFFTNGVDGKKVLEEQSWPDSTDKDKIVDEYGKKNLLRTKTLKTKTRNEIKKNEPGISDVELDQKVIDALKSKPSPEIEFSTFITNKLKSKLSEKDKNGKSYHVKFKEQEEKLKEKEYRDIKIRNLVRLATFTKGLVSKAMSTVRVEVAYEEDAYEIFETLNGKGESLSQNNLIKNWVIKKIEKTDRHDESEKWDSLIKSIGKDGVDKFLMNSLKSRGFQEDAVSPFIFGEFPILNTNIHIKLTTKNFYKIIKKRIQNDADAKRYITELEEDAKIFNELTNTDKFPTVPTQKRRQHRDPVPAIYDMAYLEAEYFRTILMTAYRKWEPDTDSFIILVKFLVPFFFRYKTVSDLGVSVLENIQIQACTAIQNSTESTLITLEKIIKYVLQFDDELIFSNNLITRFEPPSNKHAKFVLYHVESYLKENRAIEIRPDPYRFPDEELEHVLPGKPRLNDSNPTNNWSKDEFFKNYDYDTHKIIAKFEKWTDKLGNLTLLGAPANEYVGNYSFVKKRDLEKMIAGSLTMVGYNSSKLQLNKLTIMKIQDTDDDRDEWNTESIMERGTYLYEKSEEIWKLPEIFCKNIDCVKNTSPTKLTGNFSDVSAEKCCEEIGGNICDHDFEIRYPTNCGDEYKVPTEYLSLPPDPPQSISVESDNANPLEIKIKWNSPANCGTGTLIGYEIFRDEKSIDKVELDTTYTDTLSDVGTYSYSVKAISNHGSSQSSTGSEITVSDH